MSGFEPRRRRHNSYAVRCVATFGASEELDAGFPGLKAGAITRRRFATLKTAELKNVSARRHDQFSPTLPILAYTAVRDGTPKAWSNSLAQNNAIIMLRITGGKLYGPANGIDGEHTVGIPICIASDAE